MKFRQQPTTVTPAVALLAGLCGMVAGFAFTWRAGGVLMWVALVPLFALLWVRPLTVSRGFWLSGSWGIGFFLASYRFMTALHPLTWRGFSDLESLLISYGGAWLGLSLVSAVGLGLWGAVIGLIRPTGWSRVWVPAAAWMIWEWAQRLGPFAMPWDVLAVSQVGYPAFLQIGAVAGSVAVAGLIVAVNAGLASVVADFRLRQWTSWRYLVVLLVLAGINAGGGIWYLGGQPKAEVGNMRVGVVQGNFRPDQKWQRDALREMFDVYKRLSEAVAGDGVNLIVWPETAMPVALDRFAGANKAIADLAMRTQTPILVGALDQKPAAPPADPHNRVGKPAVPGPYNATALFREDGTRSEWYHKRHLVPFGEYMPGGRWLAALLPQINALPEDVQAGATTGVIALGGLRLGTLICYESLFPALAADSVRDGADLLLVITNDGWYKRSSAMHQHLGQAALRAVETHRSVVRAANTGISAFIDPFGRISAETPIDARTTLTGAVTPRGERTPYVRWGDWVIALAAALLVCRAAMSIWWRE
ncbi:MAG: apolipoprotein N-acyltransferase [Candidatus Sericytochromatia bacterium]|nr:apolipoprotein N-acyltransferase [Candidatus Sericytochromatia bacterium]